MQALIVTVGLTEPVSELLPLLESYDRSLQECDGHVAHYWMYDSNELGLFHVFADAASVTKYLESRLLSTLTVHAGCSGQTYIRWFDVVNDGVLSDERAGMKPAGHQQTKVLLPA